MSSSLPNQDTACCVGRRVNSPIHLLLGLCRKVVTMRVSLLQGFIVLCIAFHSSNISLASKRQGQHKEARLTLKPIHGGQLILSSGRIKLGEVYLSGINGLRGEKGEKGPKGDTGNQGAKGEKGDSCSNSCRKSVTTALRQTTSEPCNARLEGELRYDRTSGKLNICSRKQWHQLQTVLRGQINNSPPRKSCLEILFKGESQGDGMYWINPVVTDPERNAFRAYCDMTTAGGGWTLVAKVTHDYSWVCPDRDGGMCLGSKTDPLTANLFHDIHQRDSVDLSIKSDADAGVHLNDTIIRLLFVAGRQSVRFTFVGSGNDWTPSEDAYAAFNPSKKNSMFVDHEWGQYTLDNVDYTWNIIQQSRKDKTFSGRIICWGNKVKHSYRFYDHGLHVGSPASAHKPCLLDNNQNEVMLKSHYATLQGSPLKARWDMAQFGFLGAQYVQVPNKRIAIWVR